MQFRHEENEDLRNKTDENLYETVCLIPETLPRAKAKKSSKKLKLVEVTAVDLNENENQTLLSESATRKKQKKKRNSTKKKSKRAKSTEIQACQVKPFEFGEQNLTFANTADKNLKVDQLKSCLRDEKPAATAAAAKLVKKTARIDTTFNNTTVIDTRPVKKETKPQKMVGKVKQIIDTFEHKVIKVLHGYKSIASNSINKNVYITIFSNFVYTRSTLFYNN